MANFLFRSHYKFKSCYKFESNRKFSSDNLALHRTKKYEMSPKLETLFHIVQKSYRYIAPKMRYNYTILLQIADFLNEIAQ